MRRKARASAAHGGHEAGPQAGEGLVVGGDCSQEG